MFLSKVFNTGSENKRRGLSVDEMTAAVEEGLIRHGWFVTGRVDASLFSDDFLFEDPQVRGDIVLHKLKSPESTESTESTKSTTRSSQRDEG